MTSANGSPTDRRVHTLLIRQLDHEWSWLRHRPDALQRTARWVALADTGDRVLVETLTDSIDDLDRLRAASDRHAVGPVRQIRSITGDRPVDALPERVLRWLVRAARHDPLAARIVLQRILAPVVRGCRPDLRHGFDERLDDALGTAWMAIRTFDERRPGPVAAMLISDATRRAREGSRRRSIAEHPRSTHLFDLDVGRSPQNDPMVDLARTIRSADAAGVAPVHLDLIRELARSDGLGDIARRHGVSARTIRTRRSRAVSSVRQALGDDWCPLDDAVA